METHRPQAAFTLPCPPFLQRGILTPRQDALESACATPPGESPAGFPSSSSSILIEPVPAKCGNSKEPWQESHRVAFSEKQEEGAQATRGLRYSKCIQPQQRWSHKEPPQSDLQKAKTKNQGRRWALYHDALALGTSQGNSLPLP